LGAQALSRFSEKKEASRSVVLRALEGNGGYIRLREETNLRQEYAFGIHHLVKQFQFAVGGWHSFPFAF